MTAIIKFTPLCGVDLQQPLCYLLEVDDFCFLLDCGWDPTFDVRLLDPLKKVVSQIDAVLISHADLAHLGALPYAVGKLGLTAPIFGTVPAFKMGQMLMYDVFQSKQNASDFDLFTLDDVDATFDATRFTQLKYSQRHTFQEKGAGIEIVAGAAGRTMGGAFWTIRKESEQVVYAVDFNHKKERHLAEAAVSTVVRPTLLITDAVNALATVPSRKERDSELTDLVLRTLRANGNVLLPVDTSGRVLELLVVLDQLFVQHRLSTYGIAFVTNVAFNTLEFAKSMLEWTNDSIVSSFESSRENPFAFKHIKLLHDLSELDDLPSPRVVLTSVPSLEYGFARELFADLASQPNSAIVFTERPAPGTFAQRVLDATRGKTFNFEFKKRQPLDGYELEEHEHKKRAEKEAAKAATRRQEIIVDSDEDDEAEDIEEGIVNAFQTGYDCTAEQFAELTKSGHPMFPYHDKHAVFDEFGEVLDASDYAELEEGAASRLAEANAKAARGADAMEVDEAAEQPTKLVSHIYKLELNATAKFIDFEGRSDGRSIKTILQQVAPRHLIVVHGNEASVESLRQHYNKELRSVCNKMYTPKLLEHVDVSGRGSVYRIKLSEALLESLTFHEMGEYQLAFVNGRVKMPAQTSTDGPTPVPTLEPIPLDRIPPHKAVLLGDTKLSDLRQVLAQAGYRSDLSGGVLITADGSITVRKEDRDGVSHIRVEGEVSRDYFKIRELLYGQFRIL
eukprot:TRINITY_DN14340_c0_g1_i1.p2 TRINITY_DN14340_c0_g1~~TRINITY_DN14340_c0_g1_i1.p2  ORF type:complete len:733 (-),score=366.09 TRINITY_DN14340_c0_g1_i1:191-2389(-)